MAISAITRMRYNILMAEAGNLASSNEDVDAKMKKMDDIESKINTLIPDKAQREEADELYNTMLDNSIANAIKKGVENE